MKNILFIVLLITTCAVFSVAQETAKKGQTVKDSLNGYSFDVPADRKSETSEGGYLLADKLGKVNIIVKPHAYGDFDSFMKTEGHLERDGLKQVGEVRDFNQNAGKMIRLYKPANDKNLIVDTIFLTSPHRSEGGSGLLIVGLSTDNEAADENFKIAYKIAESVVFSRPETSQLAAQLKTLFAGKKLSYFYTGNGYTENTHIWLCSSGSFFAKNESSSSSALGSGATSANEQGSWRIQAVGSSAYLILNSNKGSAPARLEITRRQANDEIGLNGKRFFVQPHNDCL